MVSLVWADLVRELRFFFNGNTTTDCHGFSPLAVILVAIVCWIGGLVCGVVIAALTISPGCRQLVGFALHSLGSLLLPRAATASRAVEVRERLAGYRRAFRAEAYLLRIRGGGFMVALPAAEGVEEFVGRASSEEGEQLMLPFTADVDMETNRGRQLGATTVLLVDAGWQAVSFFQKAAALRGDHARQLLRFEVGGSFCRPVRTSILAAAEAWISENMDSDTAVEYGTAEEFEDGDPLEPEVAEPEEQDVLKKLMEKMAVLEQAVRLQQGGASSAPPPPPRTQANGPLLGSLHSGSENTAVMNKLRTLAGGAPGRLGAHEQQARLTAPTAMVDVAQQELQMGATEEAELEQAIMESMQTSQDPLTKLVALSLQQTAMLSRQFRKPQDPLAAVLHSGGDGRSSEPSGVKGCLAREAFVKIAADTIKLAH
eukprot:Skav215005  [mRNA]  locus=scaffold508:1257711:1259189:- [translate_table: standard]